MTISTTHTTDLVPFPDENAADESLFFEIYDFNHVPPTYIRDQLLYGKTPDAVSIDFSFPDEKTSIRATG